MANISQITVFKKFRNIVMNVYGNARIFLLSLKPKINKALPPAPSDISYNKLQEIKVVKVKIKKVTVKKQNKNEN